MHPSKYLLDYSRLPATCWARVVQSPLVSELCGIFCEPVHGLLITHSYVLSGSWTARIELFFPFMRRNSEGHEVTTWILPELNLLRYRQNMVWAKYNRHSQSSRCDLPTVKRSPDHWPKSPCWPMSKLTGSRNFLKLGTVLFIYPLQAYL